MFKNLLRITVSIGLMIFATILKAETPSVKELSKGITAFLCTEVNNLENVPYIFIEGKDGWSLNGTPDISVSKTDNGFMLKFPSPFEGIGVFNEDKDKDGSWKFEYLGEGGSMKSTCTIQNDFAFILTKALIPKIVKNADDLVQAKNNARDTLLSEKYKSQRLINNLKKKSDILEIKLADTVKKLEAQKTNTDKFMQQVMKIKKAEGTGFKLLGNSFVISTEVLFSVGSTRLGSRGKGELDKIADLIGDIALEIPKEIDWIINVDGHTDRIPFSGFGNDYKDNWELSQARALSVVRYLMDDLAIPANKLAANGFGEFQPIDDRDTPEAYKTNRRIEIRLTEK